VDPGDQDLARHRANRSGAARIRMAAVIEAGAYTAGLAGDEFARQATI
jgi:hypothetical protein